MNNFIIFKFDWIRIYANIFIVFSFDWIRIYAIISLFLNLIELEYMQFDLNIYNLIKIYTIWFNIYLHWDGPGHGSGRTRFVVRTGRF